MEISVMNVFDVYSYYKWNGHFENIYRRLTVVQNDISNSVNS